MFPRPALLLHPPPFDFFSVYFTRSSAALVPLPAYITDSYGDAVPAGLEFTNQALKAGGKSTNTAVAYPWDPTADFHDVNRLFPSFAPAPKTDTSSEPTVHPRMVVRCYTLLCRWRLVERADYKRPYQAFFVHLELLEQRVSALPPSFASLL